MIGRIKDLQLEKIMLKVAI